MIWREVCLTVVVFIGLVASVKVIGTENWYTYFVIKNNSFPISQTHFFPKIER